MILSIAGRVVPRHAASRAGLLSSSMAMPMKRAAPNNLPSKSRIFQPTTRRSFFNDGNPIPEPEFTPIQTILMDCSAWFVAFAFIYVPTRPKIQEEEWLEEEDGSDPRGDRRKHKKLNMDNGQNERRKAKELCSTEENNKASSSQPGAGR